MAFLPQGQQNQQDPNQQQNQIPAVPVIPSLQGTSGPSASQSGGTGVTNTASPAGAPSTPWQNVTSYLQANAGQAGSVADIIAGRLQGQYNEANQGIQNAQQNFGSQIEAGRVPYDQQVAQQAMQSPSAFSQNPQNIAAFQKMYNANYAGPQSFSGSQDYSNLQSNVQNAQKQAGLVNKGTPGIMTLLQQAEAANGRNPTQGITSLDALLLQEAPENFGKINAAAQPFSNLTNYLSSTQQGLDTAAQNAAQEAAQTKQQLQNQFVGPGGVVPQWQNREAAQLQDLSKQATGYNQSINDILGSLNAGKGLTPEQLSALTVTPSFGGGWSPEQMAKLAGQNGFFSQVLANGVVPVGPGMLAQYYNAPEMLGQPTLANVSSPEEYADAQALNQMLGYDTGLAVSPSGYQMPTGRGGFDVGQAVNDLSASFRNVTGGVPTDRVAEFNRLLDLLSHGFNEPTSAEPTPQPLPPPPTEPEPYVPPPNAYLPPPGQGPLTYARPIG